MLYYSYVEFYKMGQYENMGQLWTLVACKFFPNFQGNHRFLVLSIGHKNLNGHMFRELNYWIIIKKYYFLVKLFMVRCAAEFSCFSWIQSGMKASYKVSPFVSPVFMFYTQKILTINYSNMISIVKTLISCSIMS